MFLSVAFTSDVVSALVRGDYERSTVPPIAEPDITREDWNDLDWDFVLRAGESVGVVFDGNLNLDTNNIINVDTDSGNLNSLANVDYLNSSMGFYEEADFYTNWGRNDCNFGDTLIYSGYMFNNYYGFRAGGVNPFCMVNPEEPGPVHSGSRMDALYPGIISTSDIVPVDYPENWYVECAVCYHSGGICYEAVGTWDCNLAEGFDVKKYDGYLLGSTLEYRPSNERICVNRNFAGLDSSTNQGARLHGSKVVDDFSINTYDTAPTAKYTKCAICCN